MRRLMTQMVVAVVSVAAVLGMPATLAAQKKPEPMKLKVGDTAPDFDLKYFDGTKVKDVSLHEFRGKKNVVLAFFVFAFTGG